jgi:cytochrome c-type biogenesis protein CcmH
MKIIAVLLLIFSQQINASSDLYNFSTPEKKARFYSVLNELRCLVCQNQTLADSNAPVAQDLRREVAKLVEQNDTEQQVIDFLVKRYGDFVLYKPPLKNTTYILWLAPFMLLLIGFFIVIRLSCQRRLESSQKSKNGHEET